MCVMYIYKVVFAIVLCKYISFLFKKRSAELFFGLLRTTGSKKTAQLTSSPFYCRCLTVSGQPAMPCTPSVPRMAEATATIIFNTVLQFIFVILLILSYYVIVFVC